MAAIIPFPEPSYRHLSERADNSPIDLSARKGEERQETICHLTAAVQLLECGGQEDRRVAWILEECIRILELAGNVDNDCVRRNIESNLSHRNLYERN